MLSVKNHPMENRGQEPTEKTSSVVVFANPLRGGEQLLYSAPGPPRYATVVIPSELGQLRLSASSWCKSELRGKVRGCPNHGVWGKQPTVAVLVSPLVALVALSH